jgi:hypothetical protein
MSPRHAFGLVAAAAAITLAACSGGEKPAATPPPATTAPAASAPPPAATTAATATAGAEFGVPECDDYLNKYLACIDSKVPEAARATVRQSLEQTKVQWKQAASTPEGKAGLAMGCKAAADAAKTAMQAYGCTF